MVLIHTGASTVSAPTARPCIGPLACHIEGFAARLARQGYVQASVLGKCDLLRDLSGWLDRRRLPPAGLDEHRLRQFLASRRRRSKLRRGDPSTARQLLEYLRECSAVAAVTQTTTDRSAADELVREFESFLHAERGLSRSTMASYAAVARRFLAERFGRKVPCTEALRPAQLHRFVLGEVRRVSRTHGKRIVGALRSFLRFLLQRGAIRTDLARTLPGVACWRLQHLPKCLSAEQVEQLLESCDRDLPAGKRDHAILLLLARLGLRGGEVVAMTLDDLDWQHGEIIVRGKGQRQERLPLPVDVGAALAAYLCDVRPACDTRRVFIRIQAPHRGLAGPVAISCLVRRALERAGLDPGLKGAHLLRHSLASELLRRGASLGEIGQLLRHRQPTTTQIYAKVDIAALRGIALPWPGGAS